MRPIFTHNNADFDAIASQLGIYKLDPMATPILPKRLQHHVRNFLTLYASLLPALHEEDLHDRDDLEYAYLVDTQKYHSVAAIQSNLPLRIIDHHPLSIELPDHITYEGEIVGANTTLLIERLRQEDVSLSPLEASLLMLGIYEDTGSLTYGTTTARDIRAAAWLLEQDAKLDIVRDFLSHPLVNEQWELYDKLREDLSIINVAGHSILVATGTIAEQVPGIATVAHHLRNLYDPNAIFVLVQVGEAVQLIARSGVDQIDVSIAASHFGGGGHHRAAAAYIREATVENVKRDLITLLENSITPSVTVADLMSTGPIETTSVDTTISEAAQLMQQSGHEGYPVVDNDRVVGLLTRREVDRAMNHHLGDQPISQIMDTSESIYVHPDDSLETLRRKMMDSGWGQVPVLDQDSHIIGIVTRTDLIRRWGEGPTDLHQNHKLLFQLKQMLPTGLWQLIEVIADEAQQRHAGLYLVGGLVRDLMLGVPNLDIDFVVEGEAIALVEALYSRYGGSRHYHMQFGTAKWALDQAIAARLGIEYRDEWPQFIDFATARSEFYKEPTALPTVRQSSIKQDLHRRDFTINSMAIRLSPDPMGDLIDFYNGERDLHQKLIRVLHSLSFVDDPTRMLRAVRFEQRLDFKIEPRTEGLLQDALPFLNRVTGERIRNELTLMIQEVYPLKGLIRLDQLGILRHISEDLKIDEWFINAYQALQKAHDNPPWQIEPADETLQQQIFMLLVMKLSDDELQALAERLLIPKAYHKHLESVRLSYQTLCTYTPQTPPSEVVTLLETVDEDDCLLLWSVVPTAHLREMIVAFVATWRYIQPNYDGNKLIALGVERGPRIGELLRELRRAWLDNDIASVDDEDRYLKQLLGRNL